MPVTSERRRAPASCARSTSTDRVVQACAKREHFRAGIIGVQEERQVALLPPAADHGEELQQRGGGIRRREQSSSAPTWGAHDRGDQLLLAGEVAEHGALAHPGPARDVGDRGVAASCWACRWIRRCTPDTMHHLVVRAERIARASSDGYLRHRVEIQAALCS